MKQDFIIAVGNTPTFAINNPEKSQSFWLDYQNRSEETPKKRDKVKVRKSKNRIK